MNESRFTREKQLLMLAQVDEGKTVTQVAKEHNVHPMTVGRWRKREIKKLQGEVKPKVTRTEANKIALLEHMIGKLTIENHYLRRKLEDAGIPPD